MAISTPKLILLSVVLIGTIGGIFLLFTSAIIPQYSVYELFEENDPAEFVGKKIQLVGDVEIWETSNNEFTIIDWEDTNNSILVTFEDSVYIPGGFNIGQRVMIEGTLNYSESTGYTLDASQISTKCPSKYESE